MQAFGVDAHLHAGEPGRLDEGRGGDQHRAHPGRADRGDGAERRRARLRAARQPHAQALVRPRPGPRAAGRARAAAGGRAGSPTTSRSRRSAARSARVIARQNMKDRSGASVMDAKTQVTSVHGHSVLELALQPLQANFASPLVHEAAGANDRALLDIAIAADVNLHRRPDPGRRRGCARGRQLAEHGDGRGRGHRRPEAGRARARLHRALIDLFAGIRACRTATTSSSTAQRSRSTTQRARLFMARDDEAATRTPRRCWRRVRARGAKSVFVDFLLGLGGRPSRDAVLAAIATTIAWGPLMRKRISRLTAETCPGTCACTA